MPLLTTMLWGIQNNHPLAWKLVQLLFINYLTILLYSWLILVEPVTTTIRSRRLSILDSTVLLKLFWGLGGQCRATFGALGAFWQSCIKDSCFLQPTTTWNTWRWWRRSSLRFQFGWSRKQGRPQVLPTRLSIREVTATVLATFCHLKAFRAFAEPDHWVRLYEVKRTRGS